MKNYCRILLRILYLFIPKFESDFILRIFFRFSEDENAKLRQLKRLQVATEFHNRQEKRTTIVIDEHLTVMILKTAAAEPVELLLRNVESANILTKVCC